MHSLMPETTHTNLNASSPAALVTRADSTNLWEAQRWGARVRTKGEERWIDLKKPFTLVGSDPRCDVQIGDSKLPSVVYLVVACGDRIEVWPTCPLAFPIWGRVSKNHVLLVGKCRIQFYFKEDQDADFSFAAGLEDDSADISQDNFEHQSPDARADNAGGSAASVSPEAIPTAKLILDWGRGPRHKSLNRNVSIIGEDHPSLIRLHHAELYRCDHGVICFGDDVWLIELHPERLAAGGPLIRKVNPGDPSALVGGIHLWVEGAEPIDLTALTKAPIPLGQMLVDEERTATRSLVERRVSDAGQASASASSGMTAITLPDERLEESHTMARTDSADKPPALDNFGLKTVTTGVVAPESNVAAQRPVSAVRSTSHDQAEDITMELTDRLLETNARKSFRRRGIRLAAIIGLAILALVVVIGILVYGVMPIIRSIYTP